jgi:hypothetical protein
MVFRVLERMGNLKDFVFNAEDSCRYQVNAARFSMANRQREIRENKTRTVTTGAAGEINTDASP